MVSSTAVMETQFTEQFKIFLNAENDGVMRQLREKAFGIFIEIGFPTAKNEDWKYTNVAPLINETWKVRPLASDSTPVIEKWAHVLSLNSQGKGFATLNFAFGQYQVVRIGKNDDVEEPIIFEFIAANGEAIFPHILLIVESGSKATIVESYKSEAKNFTNAFIQIVLEDNAHLTHYRVQKESTDAFHVGTTEVSVGRGSVYNATNINLGGAISRHDIEVKFTAEGGEAWVDGLYMLNGSQHADTHSIIDHLVPNCTSHQTYKGVLNDKSRAVFNGKVFVRENAHGTDAQQSNKNLLLSNEARVDTKPQLEIFNDDVKCSHGATVGQLEEEELFYLLTRGLPEILARNLLTYGFAEEIINKIAIESIKMELDEAVLNRLNTKLEG